MATPTRATTARADIERRLDAAKRALSRDLRAALAAESAKERLEVVRRVTERAGFELTHHGAGLLFVRRPGPSGAPRVLLHHALGSERESSALVEDPLGYTGRGVASACGPALAAVHGLAPEAAVELHLGFSAGSEAVSAAELSARAPEVDGVILGAGRWPGARPAALTGARGRLLLRVALSTGDERAPLADTVAGLNRNALAELARLVGGLVDPPSGALRVPGLADEAEDMTIAEAQHFALSGFDVDAASDRAGLRAPRHADPLEAMEALWARPSLEVLGLEANDEGENRLPTEARARLAVYMVPRMRARAVMERLAAHLRELEPNVAVEHLGHVEAWHAKIHGPLTEALREAYRAGFGSRAALVRQPEPLPEAAAYERGLGVPVACAATTRETQALGTASERVEHAHLVSSVTVYAALLETWAPLCNSVTSS